MLKERYGDIKMYITENGLGDEDPIVGEEIHDQPRIDYIENHLSAVKKLSWKELTSQDTLHGLSLICLAG